MKANIDHVAYGALDNEIEPQEASILLKKIEKLGREICNGAHQFYSDVPATENQNIAMTTLLPLVQVAANWHFNDIIAAPLIYTISFTTATSPPHLMP